MTIFSSPKTLEVVTRAALGLLVVFGMAGSFANLI